MLPVCQLVDRAGKHHLLGATVSIVAVAGHAGYDMGFLQGGYSGSSDSNWEHYWRGVPVGVGIVQHC